MKKLHRTYLVPGLAFCAGGLTLLCILMLGGPRFLCYKEVFCTDIPRTGLPDQVHVSWSEEPATSFTVTWITGSGGNENLVAYREAGTEQWQQVSGTSRGMPRNRIWPTSGVIHRAVVRELEPGATYEYRVSSDNDEVLRWSPVYRTRTAPEGVFSFAFISDTCLAGRLDGMANGTEQIIQEIINDDPNLLIGAGDYACSNRDGRFDSVVNAIDAWFRQMEPLLTRVPLMTQYGNHEIIYLKEKYKDWAPRLAHPEGYDGGRNYSFDIGNAHFAAVFVPLYLPDQDVLDWLDADLAAARERGQQWLIVYQHEPLYSHGAAHPVRPEITRAMAPIFTKHRVDLHLAGQDRNFERTYPLTGDPRSPTAASTSEQDYQAGEGVIYLKAAPAGARSEQGYDFSKFTVAKPEFVAAWNDSAHHYALVNVSDDELRVRVYTVAGDGSPRKIRDEFTIHAKVSSGRQMK
jgi:hypothetical protein